jgi:4-hydroxy-tetrahydrodipicolinate synthase
LSDHPTIMADKDGGSDSVLTACLIADQRLAVLAGDDTQLPAALCMGAVAAVSIAANVSPCALVSGYNAVRAGRLDQATFLFEQNFPEMTLLCAESNPAPVKATLEQLGLIHGELRLPMLPAVPCISGNKLNCQQKCDRSPLKSFPTSLGV